jgi:hypothetical protein
VIDGGELRVGGRSLVREVVVVVVSEVSPSGRLKKEKSRLEVMISNNRDEERRRCSMVTLIIMTDCSGQ